MVASPGGLPAASLVVLLLGAIVILLAAQPLSSQPGAVALVGLPFAVVAGGLGLLPGEGAPLVVLPIAAVCFITLLLTSFLDLQEASHVAEAGALLLVGTAGAIAFATASDLLQAVIGLETLSLSAVTLVALGRGDRPIEASFKYFVLGALSLATLLYGIGLVYLGTGTFAFPTGAQASQSTLVLAGAVLVGLAFAFEIAVFPFHWGGLDAYTAATAPLAGFVMSVSKLATAFALGRLVVAAGAPVSQVLIWLGCATIIWGTLGAMAQRDVRRMLAYSAITHAGFIALAVGSGPTGPVTAGFYAIAYAATAMLVFGALSGRGGLVTDDESLDSRDALQKIGRVRGAALALGLFSLGGVPPLPGFWAKLAVLIAAWGSAGAVPTIIAAAGGVLSVVYYLRPLPDMFAHFRPGTPPAARTPRIALAVSAITVAGLSLFPGLAWTLVHAVSGS